MAKRGKKAPTSTIQALRGHATTVMKTLGKGHSERVYHRAMITLLNRKRIHHRSEVISPIYFMGEVVGFGRCDLIIGDLVVEFKANMRPPVRASSQLKKYMESLNARAGGNARRFKGLIVNFNQRTGRVDLFTPPVPKKAPKKASKRR